MFHRKNLFYLLPVILMVVITFSSFGNSYADDIATVPAGLNPNDVVPVGSNNIYVANINSARVTVINDQTLETLATIDVNPGPYALIFDSGNSEVYVTSALSDTVTVIDTTTSPPNVKKTITVGINPTGIVLDSVDGKIYVAVAGTNQVQVIDPSTDTLLTSEVISLPTGSAPTGISFNSLNGEIYVANPGTSKVSIIDTTTSPPSVRGSVTLPTGSISQGVAFDPQNRYVYATNFGLGSVSVIDPLTKTLVGSPISVGGNPIGIAFNNGNGKIYVANNGADKVSVIDPNSIPPNSVTDIDVGPQPFGISIDASTGKVYVANVGSDNVSIISPNGIVITPPTASINTPTGPFFPRNSVHLGATTSCGLSSCTFTYHWTLLNPLGSTSALSDPANASPSFIPDIIGEYHVSLVVTDQLGISSAPSSATIPVTAPPLLLNVPADMDVYPTSKAGAVVNYVTSTSGGSPPIGPISCNHASGSIFPIGTTTVTCTVRDSASQTVTLPFNIHVKSASDIVNEIEQSINIAKLSAGNSNSLIVKVSQYITATGQADQVNSINAFINEVNAKCCNANGKPLVQGTSLEQGTASNLIFLANQLLAALS